MKGKIMKPYKKFKPFQIRWAERMGPDPKDPYLIRWTFIFFNYSIRLHHWFRSDDSRFFHDHPWNFRSFILKGTYENVTPEGIFKVKAGQLWKSNAKARHWLKISEGGAWTILICGRPCHKWGFYKGDKRIRPLKYFYKYAGSARNQQVDEKAA